VTLVFARTRSAEAIHEALLDRRTAVYSGDRLIGGERFLKPIFDQSVKVLTAKVTLQGDRRAYVQVHNESDLDYQLERVEPPEGLQMPESIVLAAHRTVLMEVKAKKGHAAMTATVPLAYRVTNLMIGPDLPLQVTLPLEVTCTGEPK
jgi:hypothetical protein